MLTFRILIETLKEFQKKSVFIYFLKNSDKIKVKILKNSEVI